MKLKLSSVFKDGRLTILDIGDSSRRDLVKVRIFLGGRDDLSFDFGDKNLTIKFETKDQFLISQKLPIVISYIEKTLNCSIILQQEVIEVVRRTKSIQNDFKESVSNLRALKQTNNLHNTKEFQDYCDFSDKTLVCRLRNYQYEASYYLTLSNGGFDFSVPGSGKTIITYAAYNYLKNFNQFDSIFVIGPISSYNAWYDEYYTCFGKKPSFVSLADKTIYDAKVYLLSSKKNHTEITFINVEKSWRLQKEIIEFMKNKKTLLILDEGHKAKNPNAKITQSMMEITKHVEARIILTGTPMPNGYEDLYTLSKIFAPYESLLPFKYYELERLTKSGAGPNEIKTIMDSISPVYSRISKKYLYETQELKPAKFNMIECHLSNEQQEIYDFLNTISYEIDNDFDEILNINLMKAITIRKMQVSANPGLLAKTLVSTIDELKDEYERDFFDENSNNELLMKADLNLKEKISKSPIANMIRRFELGVYKIPKNEIAVELAIKIVNQGKKVIIWDVFVQNMFELKKILETRTKHNIEIVNGMVTGIERQSAISNFREGTSMILIANPATLAESISLHKACQNAIYVNRNFNAAQFIQSKDRIHRINMPLGTTAEYYFIYNADTVDEVVDERLKLKEERMLQILDSKEITIGDFESEGTSFISLEDLKAVFKK